MLPPTFPVSLQLRLDWSELDLYGHINNVQFFKYLQSSRANYWEHLGMDFTQMAEGIGPLLASTHCDFRKPLYYPGHITVRASVTEMRRSSFRMDHRILDSEGVLAAEGYDVIVLFNYGKGGKQPIPQAIRAMVEQLEGRHFPADI